MFNESVLTRPSVRQAESSLVADNPETTFAVLAEAGPNTQLMGLQIGKQRFQVILEPAFLARWQFCGCFMTNHFLFQAVVFSVFSILMSVSSIAHPAIVVIDPGHGGRDRGGIPGQKLSEKAIALDTGKRLARILRANGDIKVVMTRDDDTDVSLTERTNIANQYRGRNAVFVSIHYNSARREGAYGIETYYNDKRVYRLAVLVHPRIIQAMDSIDRGIRRRGYRVLRKNQLPAILVECGFLTNHLEGERARDPDYRQRVARAIANAILRYD